jgi:hypothetical protein
MYRLLAVVTEQNWKREFDPRPLACERIGTNLEVYPLLGFPGLPRCVSEEERRKKSGAGFGPRPG